MADEGKGVALAILGVVAVIAVVGLVLLFLQAKVTGKVTDQGGRYLVDAARLAGSPEFADNPQLYSRDSVGLDSSNYYRTETGATPVRGDLGGRATASHDAQAYEGAPAFQDYRDAKGTWEPGAEAVESAK